MRRLMSFASAGRGHSPRSFRRGATTIPARTGRIWNSTKIVRARRAVSAVAAAALAASLAAVALPAAPASAESAAGAPYTQTTKVLHKRLHTDSKAFALLRLDGLKLRKGRSRLVYGIFTATKGFGEKVKEGDRVDMLQETWITCSTGEPKATQAYPNRSALSSRNHEGGKGTKRAVSVLWLFTPPADGTYSCVLWGLGGGMIKSPKRWLDVVEGAPSTVLRVTNQDEIGAAEWYQTKDVYLCEKPSQAEECGTPTATVLRKQWTAHPEARSIDVFHGTQFSSSSGGRDPFVADVEFVVMQLNENGRSCVTPTTVTNRVSIPGVVHHLKLNRRIDGIPVHTGNGCTRNFVIKVDVKYVRTHPEGMTPNRPGLVHGPVRVNPPLRPYSTAIAMNNLG
ncbi:hypothetical protein SAMN04489764_3658 [Thermostaphylospora chromogena]|uniref:Uncharacterized protein n=1 Tax=Thermostaphylospora chromogena TaxID=35622 RepID=A0A1H1GLL0_9ACTN|nr:hypothetical protein SAMN04489764_3658 [Thermostaphylospora chromogena]